jgi:hypothetical protein
MKLKQTIPFAGVLIVVMLSLASFSGMWAGPGDKQTGDQWRESLLRQRQQKDMEFKTSPTSPMAAVNRLNVSPAQGRKTFVINKDGSISLSRQEVPGVLFSLLYQKEQWVWEPHAPGFTCTAGDKPAAPGPLVHNPSQFQRGDGVILAYTNQDKLVLLVFDSLRPEKRDFSHLIYFPPDPGFAVAAEIGKFPEVTSITMLTSQNLKKTFYRWAGIRFQLDGKEFHLTAYKYSLQGEESHILFIPFGDATNGKETYAAGRFLEIPEPGETNFILDFNRCFNPLCNYAHDAYNCPIPPMENILDVPIKAGEKTYPHPADHLPAH